MARGRPKSKSIEPKISLRTLRKHAVTITELASAVGVPRQAIKDLADAGFLCKVKESPKERRVLPGEPGEPAPMMIRVVDRISILLWLTGLDAGRVIPKFDKYIEMEIMRIARLPITVRTEQAVKLIRRYRDAESLAMAIMDARQPTMEVIERYTKSEKMKQRIRRLAGIDDGLISPVQAPSQAQDQVQDQTHHPHPSASELVPPVSPTEPVEIPPQSASESENPDQSTTAQ